MSDEARYLGFVLLATDHGTEQELHEYLPAPYTPITSRTHLYSASSPAAGLADTTRAAALLLPGAPLAGVGYACTSGSLLMGDDAVVDSLAAGRPVDRTRTTWGAMVAALDTLQARRVAVLSPYDADLGARLDEQTGQGREVVASAHHDVGTDRSIAGTSPTEIAERAVDLLEDSDVDALLVACNAWRACGAIELVEAATDVPVVTSTQALLWSLLLADAAPLPPGLGRLGRHPRSS